MPQFWPSARSRILLLLVAVGAVAAFWWIGQLVGFPRYRGFNASLLLQPMPAAKIAAVAAGFVILAALGTLVAGRSRYDAGWAVAALALYALRLRGGPIESTISDRPATIYITLAIELVVLGLILGVVWGVIHVLRERGAASSALRRFLELPEARTRLADRKAASESIDQKALALAIAAATMAVLMMILCRSGERAQVFFAVGISAYVAIWITHAFIPTRPAAWFWAAPILCGVVGYLWAAFGSTPTRLAIGEPGGFLAPLARPLPLDYASVGVAAAAWRYVQSRTHQMHRTIEAQREPAAGAPAGAAPAGGVQ